MENFVYYNPVEVVFAPKAVDQVGTYAKKLGRKAMLVTYTDISFFGNLFDRLHASLDEAGVAWVDYLGAEANPTLAQARAGVELAKKENADIIIGVGGGSAMDCAKVIAAGVCYHEDLARMIQFSHSEATQVPPEKALPMMMIPTLPATGSEMNSTAVITDEVTRRKSYVWAPQCMYAKTALIDPELTVTLPAFQTACGAADTIAHVTEAYFNGAAENLDLQDRLQEGLIRTVMENVGKVLENPNDVETRGVMMWAASLALNGWLLSGTYGWAPMHQMGHALSAKFGATHGATLACMMVAWLRFFADRPDNARYVRYADRLFGCGVAEAADQFEDFLKGIGVPTRISAFGVKESDIAMLAEHVQEVSFNADGVMASNPPVTRADVEAIYRLAL